AEFAKLLPGRPPPVSIQRWSARRLGLTLLVLAAAAIVVPGILAGSKTDPSHTALLSSDISCRHLEPTLLMAQSVPSASLVPCVGPGGCATYEFTSPGLDRAGLTNEASLAIGFVSRDDLGTRLRERSHGRLRLDVRPAGSGD